MVHVAEDPSTRLVSTRIKELIRHTKNEGPKADVVYKNVCSLSFSFTIKDILGCLETVEILSVY